MAEGTGSGTQEEGVAPEIFDSWSILIMLLLTSSTVAFAYIFQRTHFKFAHETFVAVMIGALVGGVIRLSGSLELKALTQFNSELFFFLLLPPIIFNSGYDLRRGNFFKNFGVILSFAFVGTTISTFVTGFLLYALILAGVNATEMTLIDCLIFGALISATDPVTVLAIFHSMHVDPKLFAIVFGESILNDAVAIVLFESLQVFKTNPITVGNVFLALGSFVGIFFGSFAIGTILGCFSALVFKHTYLYLYPNFEASVFIIFAYASYMLAQGVGASGIVSMLFAGIAMAHYTYPNLSSESQIATKSIFRLASFMSENFIFTYLGITIFARNDFVYRWDLIAATVFVLLISRACNVFPLAFLANLVNKNDKIKMNHQIMMWWSGLRGAIAFALSMQVAGVQGPIVVTTTLMIVVITVVVFGGSTTVMLERLKIDVHVVEDAEGDDLLNVYVRPEKPSRFVSFERNYLKKFFRMELPPSQMNDAMLHTDAPGLSGGRITAGRDSNRDQGDDDVIQMQAVRRASRNAASSPNDDDETDVVDINGDHSDLADIR